MLGKTIVNEIVKDILDNKSSAFLKNWRDIILNKRFHSMLLPTIYLFLRRRFGIESLGGLPRTKTHKRALQSFYIEKYASEYYPLIDKEEAIKIIQETVNRYINKLDEKVEINNTQTKRYEGIQLFIEYLLEDYLEKKI